MFRKKEVNELSSFDLVKGKRQFVYFFLLKKGRETKWETRLWKGEDWSRHENAGSRNNNQEVQHCKKTYKWNSWTDCKRLVTSRVHCTLKNLLPRLFNHVAWASDTFAVTQILKNIDAQTSTWEKEIFEHSFGDSLTVKLIVLEKWRVGERNFVSGDTKTQKHSRWLNLFTEKNDYFLVREYSV